MYSLKRSGHVEPISLCASRIAPLIFPAREKSASVPSPISMTLASIPSCGVAGPQPSDTARNTAPLVEGERIARRVAPSFHVTGSEYFSVCTSTAAARKPAMPHCTALAISGVPVTRPPTSSVSRRRFSIIGESPRISGNNFAAASAHEDVSVAEHATVPGALCAGRSGSTFTGGNCAKTAGAENSAAKMKRKDDFMGDRIRRRLRWKFGLWSMSSTMSA